MPKTFEDKDFTRQVMRRYACQLAVYQDAVARTLGLTASDMKCYNIIASYGSMTAGELARRTGHTTGGITRILDHLESYGVIQRRPDPQDRRSFVIEIVVHPHLKDSAEPIVQFDELVSAMTERYDAQELAVIQNFLELGAKTLLEISDSLPDTNKSHNA